jgi:acetyl-CoA C-acetyltransferase
MAQPEVVVISAVRTAIGTYGGSLKDKPPTDLAAAVVREVVKRAGIQPDEVGHVVFGNVIHTDIHDMYLARMAAVNGGLSVETPLRSTACVEAVCRQLFQPRR